MADRDASSGRERGLGLIRTALIEKKMTQAELADAADCHEKTIQNLMNGRTVRDQTLFDVCVVLGLSFPEVKELWTGKPGGRSDGPSAGAAMGEPAPVHMGAYTRAAVDSYIGHYLTMRPFFDGSGDISCYRTEIYWDNDEPCLAFKESARHDAAFSHRGVLYIPANSHFLHLVGLTKGAMRSILLSQLDQMGMMRGIITTLYKKGGPMFMPVAAPIVYVKSEDFSGSDLGRLTTESRGYAHARHLLRETQEQSYAVLVGA